MVLHDDPYVKTHLRSSEEASAIDAIALSCAGASSASSQKSFSSSSRSISWRVWRVVGNGMTSASSTSICTPMKNACLHFLYSEGSVSWLRGRSNGGFEEAWAAVEDVGWMESTIEPGGGGGAGGVHGGDAVAKCSIRSHSGKKVESKDVTKGTPVNSVKTLQQNQCLPF